MSRGRRWFLVLGLAIFIEISPKVGFPCISDFSASQTEWGHITYRWTNGCSNPFYALLAISLSGTDPLMTGKILRYANISPGILDSNFFYPNTTSEISIKLINSTTTFPSVILTTLASPPANIDFPPVKNVDSRSIRLQWESLPARDFGNPLDTLYEVQLSSEPTFTRAIMQRQSFPTKPHATVFDCLEPDTTYYTRVRAVSRVGIPTDYGINISTRTLPLSAPPETLLWEGGLWSLTPHPGDLTVEHNVQFGNAPSETPLRSLDLPNRIQTANAKMGGDQRRHPLSGGLVEIRANRTCPSEFDIALAHPATLQFLYFESGGLVDTGKGFVQPSTLSFYRLDEHAGMWNKIPSKVESGKVTASINELGTLAVMGQEDVSLQDLRVSPNPFHQGTDAHITFANLAERTTVRVFTSSGREVRSLEETDGDGLLQWDGKNSSGNSVEPGVYVYHVESPGAEKRGKVMVLR
ncbi:MAG: fibronectin type III domain-containing protein [Elusimicrobia bacterium]|nr:fibronectin type III domain-containing protein [Elusimicrobiota bacterium]